jgi:peroxin-19
VLDSFNAPKSTLGKRGQPDVSAPLGGSSATPPAAAAPEGNVDDDEFQASLIEGMESLLRSLATDHPPGPMPDKGSAIGPKSPEREAGPGGPGELSTEEEEKAFQRAVEMMLSGEGMDALGMDKMGTKPAAAGPSKARSASGAGAKPGAKPGASFDETIRKTMESLNQGGAGAAGGDGMPGDLAALLQQLSADPSALDGLGDDDDELGGLLDGMMAQLMSREVLEEPMTELAAKVRNKKQEIPPERELTRQYPAYLEKPPAGTKDADLNKYRQQHVLVTQILAVFKRPNYSDEVDGKIVAKLVGEMQDLGGPPNEIMGELPEGFVSGLKQEFKFRC